MIDAGLDQRHRGTADHVVAAGGWDEEEALFYKPSRKSDSWGHLSMDGHRWLVRMHGSERVQRLHPEHRSCPEQISDLEFMRATCAWKGKEWHRRVVIDSDWRRAELEGPALGPVFPA